MHSGDGSDRSSVQSAAGLFFSFFVVRWQPMSFALATQTALGGEYSGAVQMIFATVFLPPQGPLEQGVPHGSGVLRFQNDAPPEQGLSRIFSGTFRNGIKEGWVCFNA
jgi:hypothetical protein